MQRRLHPYPREVQVPTTVDAALGSISTPSIELRRRKEQETKLAESQSRAVETNCPLRRSLFLTPWHVLPQHFIDARLPAAPLLPECLQHVRVDPQRLVDLSVRLRRPATASAHIHPVWIAIRTTHEHPHEEHRHHLAAAR